MESCHIQVNSLFLQANHHVFRGSFSSCNQFLELYGAASGRTARWIPASFGTGPDHLLDDAPCSVRAECAIIKFRKNGP